MDEKKAKRFVSFLKNKYGEDGAKKKIQKIQKTGKVDEEDLKEFLASELKQQQAQTQKALHGAKLNYFKSLKNQCAEDEEVVYYKKGGSVSCGCKKKEDGGQVKKDCGGSAIANFKAARKAKLGDTLTRIADATGSQGGFKKAQQAKLKQEAENKKKELDARFKKGQVRVGKDILKGTNNVTKKEREDVTKDKCGSKIKKHQYGSVIDLFKMKRLGGSLNGIPFNQIFSLLPKNDNNNSITVNPEEFYNKKTIEKLRKTKVTKRPSIQYTPIYPDTLAQIIRPYIAPGEKRYVPRIAYALWGGVVEEMIPFYGSYKLGKEFVKNPSWGKAAKFGVSALGDLALLGGVTAGAGLAIKGAKAAKAATNIAKGVSKANKILKAEQAKRYYDTSAKALDDSAILYGGSSAIKATKK